MSLTNPSLILFLSWLLNLERSSNEREHLLVKLLNNAMPVLILAPKFRLLD